MSMVPLLSTPLTIAQASDAAALDDLLRCIVLSDDCSWSDLSKATSSISYEGLIEDLVGPGTVLSRSQLIHIRISIISLASQSARKECRFNLIELWSWCNALTRQSATFPRAQNGRV